MSFPKDFIWGCATSSYQIEGAFNEDGKSLSVWDIFCRKENAIWNNQNANKACDHYHRYKEDVYSMKELGLKAYRFSISWPRVIPEGIGKVNTKGLDFYNKLVDELLKNGIEPFITLFHWDYPYELYCRGGWLNNDSPEWFIEYTKVIIDKLSDRVKNWITFNEPQCFVILGHRDGRHAPGDKLGIRELARIGHNVLLSHGKAVQTIRNISKQPCKIGFAPVGETCIPASDNPDDLNATRNNMFKMYDTNLWNNSWWMDPVFFGKYPEEGLNLLEENQPLIKGGDMEIINQPIDFLGLNIYFATKIKASNNDIPEIVPFEDGHGITSYTSGDHGLKKYEWYFTPEALFWGPKFFYERYKKPIIITENGYSGRDWIFIDGKVHDTYRIDYLTCYLQQLYKAYKNGVDIRGYFQWSLIDNFEWDSGYMHRFGLVYVDYKTQNRIIKDSGYWYKKLIETNGEIILE